MKFTIRKLRESIRETIEEASKMRPQFVYEVPDIAASLEKEGIELLDYINRGAYAHTFWAMIHKGNLKGRKLVLKIVNKSARHEATAYAKAMILWKKLPRDVRKHIVRVYDVFDIPDTEFTGILVEPLEEMHESLRNELFPSRYKKNSAKQADPAVQQLEDPKKLRAAVHEILDSLSVMAHTNLRLVLATNPELAKLPCGRNPIRFKPGKKGLETMAGVPVNDDPDVIYDFIHDLADCITELYFKGVTTENLPSIESHKPLSVSPEGWKFANKLWVPFWHVMKNFVTPPKKPSSRRYFNTSPVSFAADFVWKLQNKAVQKHQIPFSSPKLRDQDYTDKYAARGNKGEPRERSFGAKSLVKAMRALSDLGVSFDDMHKGNLMVRPGTGDPVISDVGLFTF